MMFYCSAASALCHRSPSSALDFKKPLLSMFSLRQFRYNTSQEEQYLLQTYRCCFMHGYFSISQIKFRIIQALSGCIDCLTEDEKAAILHKRMYIYIFIGFQKIKFL